MHQVPIPEYDRYLTDQPCDRCERLATWTIRYRYRGGSFLERHTCNRHRRAIEQFSRRPHPSSGDPIEFQRVARTAF